MKKQCADTKIFMNVSIFYEFPLYQTHFIYFPTYFCVFDDNQPFNSSSITSLNYMNIASHSFFLENGWGEDFPIMRIYEYKYITQQK